MIYCVNLFLLLHTLCTLSGHIEACTVHRRTTSLMKMKIQFLPCYFFTCHTRSLQKQYEALCEEQPEMIQVIFPSSELLTREPLQLDLWFSELNSRTGSSKQIVLLIQFQWSNWTEWMSHKSGWMIQLLIELIRSWLQLTESMIQSQQFLS